MNKLTLNYDTFDRVEDGYSCEVKTNEKFESNDCVGDIIGIEAPNLFWYTEMVDTKDAEVREFLSTHFEQPTAVKGLINRSK